MHLRLYINVDHVATIRQARRAAEPDPVQAARLCEDAGADGITAHLREDRRHVNDDDIERLRHVLRTPFNLEMACTDEMIVIAERLKPHQVTLVPERREEITTEGGLDVTREPEKLERGLRRLTAAGIRTALFIDPVPLMVERSHWLGAHAIELHTGRYCHHPEDARALRALEDAARQATALGLAVHAGHGLTTANVGAVAAIAEIEELNIGHTIVSNAVYVGIPAAVRSMRAAMDAGRTRMNHTA
jgi:pyridoxine 5-phosphate synthase